MEVEEVTADLKDQGYPITKITRMNGKYSRPAPMVLIEMERKYKSICNIKQVNGLAVTIEPLRSSGNTIQCHRCQLYGHIQKNCNAEYRCMKCAEKHTLI